MRSRRPSHTWPTSSSRPPPSGSSQPHRPDDWLNKFSSEETRTSSFQQHPELSSHHQDGGSLLQPQGHLHVQLWGHQRPDGLSSPASGRGSSQSSDFLLVLFKHVCGQPQLCLFMFQPAGPLAGLITHTLHVSHLATIFSFKRNFV